MHTKTRMFHKTDAVEVPEPQSLPAVPALVRSGRKAYARVPKPNGWRAPPVCRAKDDNWCEGCCSAMLESQLMLKRAVPCLALFTMAGAMIAFVANAPAQPG